MKKLLSIFAFAAACAAAFAANRKVAVQTYTCNSYTLEEVCILLNSLGVQYIELWDGHRIGGKYPKAKCNYKMDAEQREYVKQMFAKYNIKPISSGVYYPKDEEQIKAVCDFAKYFGCEFISTESNDAEIQQWLKYIGDMKLAIHNHHKPPYSDYNYVAKLIAKSPNVGACADNGGWTRAGLDSVEGLKVLKGKIFTIHLKDQEKLGNTASNAKIYGTGCVDLKGMLAELDKQGFDGYFIIEHGNYDDKFQVIRKDVDFLRSH